MIADQKLPVKVRISPRESAPVGVEALRKLLCSLEDAECFGGGWFIVVATLPTGDISNHYEMKDWDLFKCEEQEMAKEWDGHEAGDVINRLKSL